MIKKIFTISYFFLFIFFPIKSHSDIFNFTNDYQLKVFDDNNYIKKNVIKEEAEYGVKTEVDIFLKKSSDNEFEEIIVASKLKSTEYINEVRNHFISYFFKNSNSIFKQNENHNLYLKQNNNSIVVQDFNLPEYFSDDKDEFKEIRLSLKDFLTNNSINIPKNSLRSDHVFLKGNGSFYWITYIYNYGIKNKSLASNVSKFYPNVIYTNKNHKLFMDNFISLSIKRHDIFQNSLKIKGKSKIDFRKLNNDLDKDLDYFRKIFYNNENVKIKSTSIKKEPKKEPKNNPKNSQVTKENKKDSEKQSNDVTEKIQNKPDTKITNESKKKNNQSNGLNLDDQIEKLKEVNDLYENGIINSDELKILKDKILKE